MFKLLGGELQHGAGAADSEIEIVSSGYVSLVLEEGTKALEQRIGVIGPALPGQAQRLGRLSRDGVGCGKKLVVVLPKRIGLGQRSGNPAFGLLDGELGEVVESVGCKHWRLRK
jgi:hypothetical protein